MEPTGPSGHKRVRIGQNKEHIKNKNTPSQGAISLVWCYKNHKI